MDHSVFDRILSKEASESEKEAFFGALSHDEELKAKYIAYKNLWAIHTMSKDAVPENRRKQLFAGFWERANRKERKNRLLIQAFRYAAVIVVTLGIGYLATDHSGGHPELVREYRTTQRSMATIQLSDNSQIWLNANSGMTIREQENGDLVATLDGEAFFEINHDETRSFIVDLGEIQIKDLGTSFNVKAYRGDEQIETTLVEGAIDIQNASGEKLTSMNPEENLKFYRSENRYTVNLVDTDLVTGWKEGKFVFLELTLREICDELEKWYNVKIVIDPKRNTQELFSSVMKKTTTIKQVLELLKLTTGMNYRIAEKENETDVVFLY